MLKKPAVAYFKVLSEYLETRQEVTKTCTVQLTEQAGGGNGHVVLQETLPARTGVQKETELSNYGKWYLGCATPGVYRPPERVSSV